MEEEKEIRKILVEKLVNNEESLADVILSYLKRKCFICWKDSLRIHQAYCDCKEYRQLYMDVCDKCIIDCKFIKCYKCKNFCDGMKCYCIDINRDSKYYVCYYCSSAGWTID